MLTLFATVNKRIPSETRRATTDRAVIDNIAASVCAASARARVFAFLINASLVLGTIGADHALGSARGWRADVAHLARANGVIIDGAALAIGAAWRRMTRVERLILNWEETQISCTGGKSDVAKF